MNGTVPNGTVFYQHEKKKKNVPSCLLLQKFSSSVANLLENGFYRLGFLIGTYPVATILICLAVTGVFAGGMSQFYEETKPGNLWVPDNSDAQIHRNWIEANYPADYLRFQFLIIEADNVLDSAVLTAMLDLDSKVKAISVDATNKWDTLCARLGGECWSRSLLELWSFNQSVVRELSNSDIISTLNSTVRSPVFFAEFDVTKFLGQIQRDENGTIVSAKAAFMQYVLRSNDSLQNEEQPGNALARAWEEKFIEVAKAGSANIKNVYYSAQRSNEDIGSGAIFGDINLLFAGFIVIFLFVSITLGKFNCVFQRFFLSVSGLLCIGFAIVVSIGLSSYASVFFGPLHNILPFLLLGVGVDDMFVIIQAWEMNKEKTSDLAMPERIGLMLKRAGVSITITSLTDIVAFGIGATTVIPALRSFCIYSSIGILGLYFFASTLFVACITLDNQRASTHRNACCCCYVHRDYQPNRFSQMDFMQMFFDKIYAPNMTRWPVKLLVLLLTAGFLAPGLYGVIHLEQDFDPNWFIPDDTYLKEYLNVNEKYFPDDGRQGYVYIGDIDYPTHLQRLVRLHSDMESLSTISSGSVESWFYYYHLWLQTSTNTAVTTGTVVNGTVRVARDDQSFYQLLQLFLFGDPVNGVPALGARYTRDIVFNETSANSTAATRRIKVSKVAYQHTKLNGASAEIQAMEQLRQLLANVGIQTMFPYSRFYLIWEGNKVIQIELFRNIGLAFLCVFVMTLILIAQPLTCIYVSICVIATLVDVGGLIYWWGLTVDTVTAINLILAVGLAVDYAAHIGHVFMTVKGSRNERTRETLSLMGPAVFNGGFSTFLAFILLAGSTSYVFRVFFRVFFGVVMFGLFHGLALLPVILSLIGPAPYLSPEELKQQQYEQEEQKIKKYDTPRKLLQQDGAIPVGVEPVQVAGSITGTDNQAFDTPDEVYAKVNKKRKETKKPASQEQVDPMVWDWKNYSRGQNANHLPVRGNWNQPQPNVMYPQWNSQWAPYQGYFTVGANPGNYYKDTGKVGWKTAARGKSRKSLKKESVEQPRDDVAGSVTAYPYYYDVNQYNRVPPAAYPQRYGFATMLPTDRFY